MTRHNAKGRHALLPKIETRFASETAIWREDERGDMRVGYETCLKDFDDARLLESLPYDRCQFPHRGYLIAGRMTVQYSDHDEVVKAGEVSYMDPER